LTGVSKCGDEILKNGLILDLLDKQGPFGAVFCGVWRELLRQLFGGAMDSPVWNKRGNMRCFLLFRVMERGMV
jgi:hypothetical protein